MRRLVAVVPSVACTNHTVDLAATGMRGVVSISHQHGCGQLGGDLAVTRELLVRTCAHPNVVAAVVVGLGCETNQARAMGTAIDAAGGHAEVVVLQESGGMEATVAAVRDRLARLIPPPPAPAPVPADGVLAGRAVGLLWDRDSGGRGKDLASKVAAAIAQAGGHPLTSGPTDVAGKRVSPADPTEALTLLAARGAHLACFVTGRADPVGSPVMPTLKVGVEPSCSQLLGDVLDLDVPPEQTLSDAAHAVLALLEVVSTGAPTAAERFGQRDFAIPRIAPTM